MSDNENLTKDINSPSQSNEVKNTQSAPIKPPTGNVIKATDENFESLIKSQKPILIDFWAPWCSPCKMLERILDEISKEMTNEITIAKLNIDNDPNTPTKFSVKGIPTMILFINGEQKAIKVGASNKADLVNFLKKNI